MTVLLLDLYIDPSLRSGDPATLLGVAAFKLLMLDLVPLGLLLVWSITQCSQVNYSDLDRATKIGSYKQLVRRSTFSSTQKWEVEIKKSPIFQGRGRQSSREVASWVIAGVLVLHHLAATAQFVVYTMEKTTTDLAFQLQLVRAIIVIKYVVKHKSAKLL